MLLFPSEELSTFPRQVQIGLFVAQSQGSERIGAYFGPIMAMWFVVLAAAGLMQVLRDPGVLAALNPRHALNFLTGHGWIGFFALGSVFLAHRRRGALYADMGHFGRGPIRAGTGSPSCCPPWF